jgi:hypothetical protein
MWVGGYFVYLLLLQEELTKIDAKIMSRVPPVACARPGKIALMNSLRQPKLRDPGIAYGIISGFPVHDNYPVEDREKLDKLFRGDYFAWEAMSKAAISRFATNRSDAEAPGGPSPFSHYRVNGWWEYKGRRIVDNGFILFGSSDALHDFMKGYNRPYILKTETQTETVSLFSNQDCDAEVVFVGDLQDWQETLVRVYGCLRAGSIFGAYTLATVANSLPLIYTEGSGFGNPRNWPEVQI